MTAVPREVTRVQDRQIINGEIVTEAPANPHRAAMQISSLGLVAVAVGSVYGLHTHPDQLKLVAGADTAAIGLFLANMLRWMRHEEQR